jgi:hypothetical protein
MHVKLSPVLQIVRGIIKTLETSSPHATTEPVLDLQKPLRSHCDEDQLVQSPIGKRLSQKFSAVNCFLH